MNTQKVEKMTEEEIKNLPAAEDYQISAVYHRVEIERATDDARKNPRSLDKVIKDILTLATLDAETAAESMYALPRGGKPIRGPSVRLAEIIAQSWGNNRVHSRVIDIDRTNKVIVAESTFHDLQSNSALRTTIHRRIADKNGRLYTDDMIVVTGNAACAIARRNAILAGVPKAVWRRAYDAAEKVVKGDIKTLVERREAAIKAFAHFGVKPEQIFGALDVKGVDDITLDHIPTLLGMFSALKNGEETVESMFDPRRTGGRAFEVVANPLKDDATIIDPDTGEIIEQDQDHKPAQRTELGTNESAKPPEADRLAAEPASKKSGLAADHQQEDPAARLFNDPIEAAIETGRRDHARGHARKAVPGEYRDRSSLATAWLKGWDAAAKASETHQ